MKEQCSTPGHAESPDEWYERERAAFIAWWESEGQKKFGETPTLAAGAGWLARAEAVRSETASRLPPEANELARMAANDRRYRRLADAAGRTWDKLAGAHLMGQLDSAIDHLGDDE